MAPGLVLVVGPIIGLGAALGPRLGESVRARVVVGAMFLRVVLPLPIIGPRTARVLLSVPLGLPVMQECPTDLVVRCSLLTDVPSLGARPARSVPLIPPRSLRNLRSPNLRASLPRIAAVSECNV